MACKIRGLMVTVCPSQFATRRTLFHVLVGCGLLMLKVSRLKLPVIWLLVSMWLNTLTKIGRAVQQECRDRKSGSAGMPRPISYAAFFSFSLHDPLQIYLFPSRRSSDLACKIRGLMVTVFPSQFAIRRTLFHVLVGCGLLMLKVSRLKLPVIWLLVDMWLSRFA